LKPTWVEGIIGAFILWRILAYRQWQLDVTGASGRTYTLFKASRDPIDKHFEIDYRADGFSVADREIAEADLVTWGAPLATARRCTVMKVCGATNVRATRFWRFYHAHATRCATFKLRSDGSWSKEVR
jgi:hypothetical protein